MRRILCLIYTILTLAGLCTGCGLRHEHHPPLITIDEYYDDYYGSELTLDNPYR
jgi:hypothetical protein